MGPLEDMQFVSNVVRLKGGCYEGLNLLQLELGSILGDVPEKLFYPLNEAN